MMCRNQVVGRTKEGRLFLHPCGQCLYCRINDTRAWYVRSHFELKKLDRPYHYFLTLTYDEENLPDDGICRKDHIKNFLNNLNTSFALRMRYFATSDYGSINNRAHYHAIITSTKKITQAQCERIWKKGFVYLKKCNKENVKYTLRYTVKKAPYDKTDFKMFRLISKGWGDNVKQYYTGQDYFIIDGKKYGITDYLRKKIGLDKSDVVTYYNFCSMLQNCPDYSKKTGNYSTYLDDMNKLNQTIRRYNR
ncbi:MAG: replication initiator protein [Microviridae sp.]|nr:MAG: replication initiator protein [Microviridae sp.]